MKQLLTIVKLLFKNTYRGSLGEKKGGKIAIYVLFALIYVLFEVAMVTTIVGISQIFAEIGLVSELITAVSALGLTAVASLGLMPMLNLLYFSKDSEFYLSLPVSSVKVYLAKLLTIYFSQLAFTAAILIPALFSIGITLKLSVLYYITTLFSILLMPIFPLAFLSILCLPLMYLIGFFRNKGAIGSIAALMVFVALFFVYMMFIGGSNTGDESELAEALFGPVRTISMVFYPLLALNRFATYIKIGELSVGVSMLLNILIFIVALVVLSAIAFILTHFSYKNVISKQLEHAKSSKGNIIYNERKGAVKALMMKEWKEIIRNPMFTVQCFSGLIMTPVMLIIMGISGVNDDVVSACVTWFIVVGFIQMLAVSVNIGASTSFSREGNSFYMNKLLPISDSKLLRAKIMLYTIIYSIDITLCIALWLVFGGYVAWWLGLMLYAYLLILNYGYISFCLLLDLSKPKLDWKSYREIVKNSRNAVLPVVIGEFASILLAGGGVGIFILISQIASNVVASVCGAALLIVIAITFAVLTRLFLHFNSRRYFDRIEA